MTEPLKTRDLIALVPRLDRLCPQQIVADPDDPRDAEDGALLDQWGRLHRLWTSTIVGRELDDTDIAILEGSVSRRHVEFRRRAEGTWTVTDLGSTNGTFVEGRRIHEPTDLQPHDRVTIGDVGFAFVAQGEVSLKELATESIKRTLEAQGAQIDPQLVLLGPAPSGGGVVEHDGTYVQLGPTQYALVEFMAGRQRDDASKSPEMRGFVRSIDLITELPWETPYPEDNNVKQLVRRVRRAFERANAPNPIESRHGLGYRLAMNARITGS